MGALPIHHTATEDSPWDANAAVSAMPEEESVLKYCFAWQRDGVDDNDNDDTDHDADDLKTNYKFPHHKTKGGAANIPACRNGLARLSGSKIPEGDKEGVRKHLQAHLDDFNDKSSNLSERQLAILRRGREMANKALKAEPGKRWFNIASSGSSGSISIYDDIGFFGISAQDFIRELNALKVDDLEVRISSYGGEVFDGIAILNALRAHPANITVVVDSLAASIASVIAQAGDKRIIMPNATMMIHEAAGIGTGNAQDMRDTADVLDRMSDNIASVYAQRSGKPVEEWRDAMRAETWYGADEAVAAGLMDEVGELPGKTPSGQESPSAPVAVDDLSWYRTVFAYADRNSAPGPHSNTSQFDPEEIRAALREAFGT